MTSLILRRFVVCAPSVSDFWHPSIVRSCRIVGPTHAMRCHYQLINKNCVFIWVFQIETADFEALTRKLYAKKVDPNLVEILQGIKTR